MSQIKREIVSLLDRPATRRGPWVIPDEMLHKLTDLMVDDIMALTDEELAAECEEDGTSVEKLSRQFDLVLKRVSNAHLERALRLTQQEPNDADS